MDAIGFVLVVGVLYLCVRFAARFVVEVMEWFRVRRDGYESVRVSRATSREVRRSLSSHPQFIEADVYDVDGELVRMLVVRVSRRGSYIKIRSAVDEAVTLDVGEWLRVPLSSGAVFTCGAVAVEDGEG